MKQTVRAVIFDQDGLMFDTERVSAEAWKIAGDGLGLELPESFLCTIRGMSRADSNRRFLEHFGKDFDINRLRNRKQQIFEELLRSRGVPVKPGLKELLAFLKEKKVPVALATASTREYSLRNLTETGILEYFDQIVSGDMVTRSKPDPELFLAAAGKLGVEPACCMVLEDSLNGLEAGIRGGFITIMVPDLTQPDEALRGRLAGVCRSLTEVKEYLEKTGVLYDGF